MNLQLIEHALDYDQIDVIKLVIKENNKDMRILDDNTLLFIACNNGSEKCVDYLLKLGSDPNLLSCGISPLEIAVHDNYLHIVKLLLKYKINVDKTDIYGRTSIFNASRNDNIDIVEELLKCDANCNLVTNDGFTALSIACSCAHNHIVKLLLCNGADPNVYGENSDEDTIPLCIAVKNGDTQSVKLLLCNGANTNVFDINGNSLLHIVDDDELILEELLRHMPNINILNKCNQTPLEFASQRGNYNIVAKFVKHEKYLEVVKNEKMYILQMNLIRNVDSMLNDEYLPHDMFIELCKMVKAEIFEKYMSYIFTNK
jgi:ankyrin repeat protein